MRHLPINNTPPELIRVVNRIWDAIEKGSDVAPTVTTRSNTGISGSGGGSSSVSVGPAGPAGVDGADGATGDPGLALVGAKDKREVLMELDGSVLTDEHGYALIGVNTENEVLCGVIDDMISPLAGV